MAIPSIFLRPFLVLLILAAAAPAVAARQLTLMAAKDNTLFETTDGGLSNGSGRHFFAGRTNQGTGDDLRRGVLEFDVAGSLPAGSVVTGVSLTLYMSKTGAGPRNVTLHRALVEWGEGASNAGGSEGAGDSSEPGDATWLHTDYPGSFWSSPGGEFAPAVSATTIVDGEAFYTWSSPLMMIEVQSWLDGPAENHGWVLRGDETSGGTAKRFDSRENNDAAQRPRLVVDFDPPSGGGACCFDDGTCVELSDNDCTLLGGSYQGDGSTCAPMNPCPQPTGGCCLPGGNCVELTEAECLAQSGVYQGDDTGCSPNPCPVELTPYVDPLPLPAVATPVSGSSGGAAEYEIAITEFTQQLHSQLPPTRLWGYGGLYPGPTIEAFRDAPVSVRWMNDLRDAQNNLRSDHLLPVDPCPHGAALNDPRTIVHLHGGHVPAAFDGYPEDAFLPGQEALYQYPNHQLPAAIWYHDHALGITRLNVMLGLAGFYIIRDQFELDLGLPANQFEVPLAIQDRIFNNDGSLDYPADWQDNFFGDKILVNGKVWPYLEVAQGKYRFRVLNGSNSRTYTLSLSTGDAFQVIGGDGGLLPAPVTVTEQTLASGERSDWIVDFATYAPGTEILLQNSAPAPFPGSPGQGVVPQVMQFVVTASAGHTDPVPAALRPQMSLPESSAVIERDFLLRRQDEPCAGTQWLINDLTWDDITELPQLGTTEIWAFANRSNIVHPMHMHLVFFQVLDRQDFDLVNDEIVPFGNPVPPDPTERGWKDTVRATPQQITRVIARFTDFEGLYPYHCHILEHEDHEMMRQFESVLGPGLPYCFCDVTGPCGNDDADAGCVNAGGFGGYLSGQGSGSVTADDLVLTAALGNAGMFGVFYRGMGQTDQAFGDGRRCVGNGQVQRLPISTVDLAGVAQVGPGLVVQSMTTSLPILSGQTWNWQFWYRDPTGPCGTGFNLTNGLSVLYGP